MLRNQITFFQVTSKVMNYFQIYNKISELQFQIIFFSPINFQVHLRRQKVMQKCNIMHYFPKSNKVIQLIMPLLFYGVTQQCNALLLKVTFPNTNFYICYDVF